MNGTRPPNPRYRRSEVSRDVFPQVRDIRPNFPRTTGTPRRGRGAQNSEPTGKDAGARNNQATHTAQAPDTAYAVALTLLGNEHAAGWLDKDLAVAAAQSLGHVYREKHLVNSGGADGERSRKAVQAESAACRIREELVGSGQHGP